ncbi:hypothetical protein LDENG_00045640 [Lucifuga dentata]|nr:hypothetical protein LDENG_00045640 [Lucifuga dentata]
MCPLRFFSSAAGLERDQKPVQAVRRHRRDASTVNFPADKMGNLQLGSLFRFDAALSENVRTDWLISRKISKGITYYYTPFPAAGGQLICPAKDFPAPTAFCPTSSPSQPTPSPPDSSTPLISGPFSPTPMLPEFASTSSPSSSRPLVLLLSWLGARPRGVAKYMDLYLERGMDVLVVQSSVMHFLWPRWGLDYGLEILKVLEDPQFSGRLVLVQAFSIGGYTFTQILTHIAQGPEKYASLTQRLIGHIYDSMVVGTLEHMATGLGKTLLPRLECLVKKAAMFYFWLFKIHTADFYNNSVHIFHNSPVTAPALFFFCENDALCDPVVMEKVIDIWRKRGVAVESRTWKESTHAGHMRCHPEDYVSTLDKFLNSLPLLKCKEAEE